MWGNSKSGVDTEYLNEKKVLQEVMHDPAPRHPRHDLKKQTDLHEKIRNESDYDDWEYGTEPVYGKKWQ